MLAVVRCFAIPAAASTMPGWHGIAGVTSVTRCCAGHVHSGWWRLSPPCYAWRFCRFESLEYMRLGGAVPEYSVSKHHPPGSSFLSGAWPPMGQAATHAVHLSCRCLFVHVVSFDQWFQPLISGPVHHNACHTRVDAAWSNSIRLVVSQAQSCVLDVAWSPSAC